MNIYKNLPSGKELESLGNEKEIIPQKVNGHFHTPYSFSAFTELEQVFSMAKEEQIAVLGINDFYTMAGYEEFARLALKYRKFPLFNIEFIGLLKEEQTAGVRVNDPNNPGRTYLSGKGLDYPVSLSGTSLEKLNAVKNESDKQAMEMVKKASAHLEAIDPALQLDYNDILTGFTKGMVRERHIAQVIRTKVYDNYSGERERKQVLTKIFEGIEPKTNINDTVALDGEIRSILLKSGGVAFVKEDPKAFLDISEVIDIIVHAGGIPCYPVLLDDSKGNFTDFESDMEQLHKRLSALKICSLELIPGRNKMKYLKPFVEFFNKKGYIITFGTEHNTPALDSLTVSAGDGELDKDLIRISYEGACVIAAHQYLRSTGETGFIDDQGNTQRYITLGNAIIQSFISD